MYNIHARPRHALLLSSYVLVCPQVTFPAAMLSASSLPAMKLCALTFRMETCLVRFLIGQAGACDSFTFQGFPACP
jgi:hypothetical protein